MKVKETTYKNKKYKFIRKPFYDLAMLMYEAPVVDENNEKFLAFFDVIAEHEDDETLDTRCNREQATGLVRL